MHGVLSVSVVRAARSRRRAHILCRIGRELRLAAGAAEQNLFAVMRQSMRRVRFNGHAADRIDERRRGSDGGMIVAVMAVGRIAG